MRTKLFLLTSLPATALLTPLAVTAQYAGASYESGPAKMEILQVDNRELSTMVYMAYTTPDDDNFKDTSSWMNFGDKTHIKVPGSNKQYHMHLTFEKGPG